ncbi:MAG: hypothetical protein ACREAJ_02920 [Nitrosopumilaceae archaeon]
MRNVLLAISILLLLSSLNSAFAAGSILITYSDTIERAVFDGKWTDQMEWKQSSWDKISTTNGDAVHIRSAHQGDFIYILLDVIADRSIDHLSDRAIVCIDGYNDKTSIAGVDDYCFLASLDGKQGFVFQGGSSLALNGHFKKITSSDGFIGVGGKSDLNDKYSQIPHASFEFKIPLNLFGRSDVYGFYVLVYDASGNQYYSWPVGIDRDSPFDIPSPSNWGNLVSPDKSIPEFDLPILALVPAIFLVIYFTRMKKFRTSEIK